MNQAASNLADRSARELYKMEDFSKQKGAGTKKLY